MFLDRALATAEVPAKEGIQAWRLCEEKWEPFREGQLGCLPRQRYGLSWWERCPLVDMERQEPSEGYEESRWNEGSKWQESNH